MKPDVAEAGRSSKADDQPRPHSRNHIEGIRGYSAGVGRNHVSGVHVSRVAFASSGSASNHLLAEGATLSTRAVAKADQRAKPGVHPLFANLREIANRICGADIERHRIEPGPGACIGATVEVWVCLLTLSPQAQHPIRGVPAFGAWRSLT